MANLYTSENYLIYNNGTDVFTLSKSHTRYSSTTVGVHVSDSFGVSFELLSADVGSLYNDSTSTNLFADWDAVILFLQQNTGFFLQTGYRSTKNSSSDPLDVGATFTGIAELNDFPEMLVQVTTDQDGTLTIELSDDGTNWDTVLRYDYVVGNINPAHRIGKGVRYARTSFQNTSGIAQTEFRLHCSYGSINPLTSGINSIISQNFDAQVVRPIDFNLMASKGLYEGHRPIRKDGIVDTTSSVSLALPDDIWENGGIYSGFPATTGTAEIIVTGADIGTIYYSYLAESTSTDYVFTSIAVTGPGTYALGHNVFRCNFMLFVASTRGVTNVGLMTMQRTATPATTFCVISAGIGQSYCSAYTIPPTQESYLDRITGVIRGGANASADGYFYFADYTTGYRLRYPFTVNFGGIYFDDSDFMDSIGGGVDIIPRIVASTNNTEVGISFRVMQVKE